LVQELGLVRWQALHGARRLERLEIHKIHWESPRNLQGIPVDLQSSVVYGIPVFSWDLY
jgi:hypothetical protein